MEIFDTPHKRDVYKRQDDPYIQRQIKYLKQVEKAATKERK